MENIFREIEKIKTAKAAARVAKIAAKIAGEKIQHMEMVMDIRSLRKDNIDIEFMKIDHALNNMNKNPRDDVKRVYKILDGMVCDKVMSIQRHENRKRQRDEDDEVKHGVRRKKYQKTKNKEEEMEIEEEEAFDSSSSWNEETNSSETEMEMEER